jgi:signal peptidase I
VSDKSASGAKSELIGFIKSLIPLVAIILFLRGSVIEAFTIPSSSMEPTLRIGDFLFIWKLPYGLRLPFVTKTVWQYRNPVRGDVVVFVRDDDPITPDDESQTNIIKRVMGVPGDTIEVRGPELLVNNQKVDEPYAQWEEGGPAKNNFGPVTVPAGSLFLLGDNRDHSKDSRFWYSNHFLPIKNVKGQALIIYWSNAKLFSRIGKIIR